MERHAYGYIRVSGKGQLADDRDGFPRQRAALERYASQHDIRLVQIFEERGISGATDLDSRPALQALNAALHTDGVTLVLVERLDRLARDLMIQESILADLRRHGFELVSVSEPDLCSDDPSRKLMRQVLGAFAEYERTMIVQKLRGARQRIRAKTGRCEGRKPFGMRDGEEEILARIRSMAASGLSTVDIADALNKKNVPTRLGGAWYAGTVTNILKRH